MRPKVSPIRKAVADCRSVLTAFDVDLEARLATTQANSLQQLADDVVAVQGLYASVASCGEDWTLALRKSLLAQLQRHLKVPVEQPDLLALVLRLIPQQGALKEAVEVIESALRTQFFEQLISNEAVAQGASLAGEQLIQRSISGSQRSSAAAALLAPAPAETTRHSLSSLSGLAGFCSAGRSASTGGATSSSLTQSLLSAVDEQESEDYLASRGPCEAAEDVEGVDASRSEELQGLLRNASDVISKLHLVVGCLVPIVPPEYDILQLYQQCARDHIIHGILRFLKRQGGSSALETTESLSLLCWVVDYRAVLERFGAQLDPELQQLEEDLIERYCRLVRSLMQRWTENILKLDADPQNLLQREGGAYFTHAPEDLFRCLKEQLQLAEARLQGPSLRKVYCANVETIDTFYQEQLRLLQLASGNGRSTSGGGKGAGGGGGRCSGRLELERLASIVNNCCECSNLLTEVSEDFLARVGDTEDEALETAMIHHNSRLMTASALGIDLLAEQVLEDPGVRGLYQQLFSPQWLEDDVLTSCLRATLNDFFDDLKTWLQESVWVTKLLTRCLKHVVASFLERLLATPHLKAKNLLPFADRVENDARVLEQTFLRYHDDLSPNVVAETCQTIHLVVTILTAELDAVASNATAVVAAFGVDNYDPLISTLLVRRGEPAAAREGVMRACRQRVAEADVSTEPKVTLRLRGK